MSHSCNVHNACSCENHDLPTYEEAIGIISPRIDLSERTFVAPKRETNHDRQPLSATNLQQPSIDSTRHARNTDYTHEPSSTYRNNSYTSRSSRAIPPYIHRQAPVRSTTSNVNRNRTRRYDAQEEQSTEAAARLKEETPCQNSFVRAMFIVFSVFVLIAVFMNLREHFRAKSRDKTKNED